MDCFHFTLRTHEACRKLQDLFYEHQVVSKYPRRESLIYLSLCFWSVEVDAEGVEDV